MEVIKDISITKTNNSVPLAVLDTVTFVYNDSSLSLEQRSDCYEYISFAAYFVNAGQYKRAIRMCNKALAIDANNPTALKIKAQAKEQMQKSKDPWVKVGYKYHLNGE